MWFFQVQFICSLDKLAINYKNCLSLYILFFAYSLKYVLGKTPPTRLADGLVSSE